ncbi:hypothetical protein SLS58_011280 [Diplodia intermedia]|uniref:F-box domain-containing protein n=1 Tax=Diplodia intermedia TaxID=856260 RepID=A0ABR3T0Q4_9PEZI
MGSWDCYCAVCGSALGAAHVSARPRTARFHRWREAQHRRAQADESETENDDAEKSDDVDDETFSIDSYEEKFSYDPAILSEADLEWMRPVHVLGFNPDAKGVSKAFVAGPGHYWDYSFSYYSVVSDITAVFPFHWCCFELLLKALTGTADPGMLEKDLLYSIMEDLASDCASRLDLDYGTPDPEDGQFWESRAGEEAYILDQFRNSPTDGSARFWPFSLQTFKKSPHESPRPDLAARIAHDPFAEIPYDILYKILCLLPLDSLMSLANASWPVHVNLLSNHGFWKQLIRRSMPWFFELHELMEDSRLVEDCDYRKLFLWLEQETRPRGWMDGPFLAVANRRRIWAVCEQLAERYHERLARRAPADCPDQTAQVIMKYADNPQMPLVAHPPPTAGAETVSTQWILSPEELDARVASFSAFWDCDQSLVGLAMLLNGTLRLFGRDDSVEGVTKETVTVEDPAEVRGLILHLFPRKLEQHGTQSSIRGVTNGKIYRLGLLQWTRPPMDDFALLETFDDDSDAPFPQRCLWRNDLREYLPDPRDRVWNLPSLRVVRPNDNSPEDMVPCEALLWAKDLNELRQITRLSANVIVGGTVSGTGEDGKWYTRNYHVLCGASVQYTPEYGQPERFVGLNAQDAGGVDVDKGDQTPRTMVDFDIDGPGGEEVTSVKVATQGISKALKVRALTIPVLLREADGSGA